MSTELIFSRGFCVSYFWKSELLLRAHSVTVRFFRSESTPRPESLLLSGLSASTKLSFFCGVMFTLWCRGTHTSWFLNSCTKLDLRLKSSACWRFCSSTKFMISSAFPGFGTCSFDGDESVGAGFTWLTLRCGTRMQQMQASRLIMDAVAQQLLALLFSS